MNTKRRYPIEVLTPQESSTLISAVRGHGASAIRNRALITTLYRSGLRISEALDLEPKDLDAQQGSIRVCRGKGGKTRVVGVDPGAVAIIERWLQCRHEYGITGSAPLFCTLCGDTLSASYVRKMIKRYASKAGIVKRVHPHGLRHTHAAELCAEGVPINVISKQLGHSNISTTSQYIDHIAPRQVIEAMQQRAWVCFSQEKI